MKNKSPTHDTCSTRALCQERPRKFKRHTFVQCRVPGTGDEVKEICLYIPGKPETQLFP